MAGNFILTEVLMTDFTISSVSAAYQTSKTTSVSKTDTAKNSSITATVKEDTAAVFEKSDASFSINNNDPASRKALVDALKADADARTKQFTDLVHSMISKQGGAFKKLGDLFEAVKKGEISVDPEVVAQAKADVAEDGYWGVKQTSERLISFAKGLAGNDPDAADKMIDAVKKGFNQATKAWGSKLPDICQETVDKTVEALEKWRDELKGVTTATE